MIVSERKPVVPGSEDTKIVHTGVCDICESTVGGHMFRYDAVAKLERHMTSEHPATPDVMIEEEKFTRLHKKARTINEAMVNDETPVAVIRGMGVYELSFSGTTKFHVITMDEAANYVGCGDTLNDALEIAVMRLTVATIGRWMPNDK